MKKPDWIEKHEIFVTDEATLTVSRMSGTNPHHETALDLSFEVAWTAWAGTDEEHEHKEVATTSYGMSVEELEKAARTLLAIAERMKREVKP